MPPSKTTSTCSPVICLGFDPSLSNFGWALHDTAQPVGTPTRCLESGRFQTSSRTLFIDRYMDLREHVRALVDRVGATYGVSRIGVEYPIFHDLYSEGLYGLFLYNCEALKAAKMDVVFFSPGQVKVHAAAALGRPKGWKMGKPDMVEAAKADMGGGKAKNHNEADAYFIAVAAGRFWNYYDGNLKDADLTPAETKQFTEIHTYQRGAKVGKVVHKGIIYNEDRRYFQWSKEF